MSKEHLIRIHPRIDFDRSCPRDGSDLEANGVIIPGMRPLADACCPVCGSKYYVDLPTSHALWSPMIIDKDTSEIWDPRDAPWYRRHLEDYYCSPETRNVSPLAHRKFDADRIVLLNCLDFIYGHSLLKLLNAQRYLDAGKGLACCVLVPTQLVHLVPDGVAEIWEFPIPIRECGKWYSSVAEWIGQQIRSRAEVLLSPAYSHPSHSVYDLRRFVRDLPTVGHLIGKREPVVLFSYREDRLWGASVRQQQRNLQAFYEQMRKVFPDMAFVMVGFGNRMRIRDVQGSLVDARCNSFSVDTEKCWMALMEASDLAIGVHGSNMLLPSGLAGATVELLPRDRLGNVFQDFLFPHTATGVRDGLLNYRIIYGNDTLTDVHPSLVADIAASVIGQNSRNSWWFKFGESDPPYAPWEATWVTEQAVRHLRSPGRKRNMELLRAVVRKAIRLTGGRLAR